MGIVTPHINTSWDAEKAMQSSKYAPLGYRGMFGGRQSYGVTDYFHQANEQTMVVVLLEEAEALRNLEATHLLYCNPLQMVDVAAAAHFMVQT